MYATWKTPGSDHDPLIGVVACRMSFLSWSNSAVYHISRTGKLIEKFPLHDDPVGVPRNAIGTKEDGDWLLATKSGFRSKMVSSSSSNMKEFENMVCAVSAQQLLTNVNLINIKTGECSEHGMREPRGALFFEDALVMWGPDGLRVGKNSVCSRSVIHVWNVYEGLWYKVDGEEQIHFWNAYMTSEAVLNVGCCSDRAMVTREGLDDARQRKRIVVRSSLGTGEVIDYTYFNFFAKENALAINSSGEVAGLFSEREIVIFDENTRNSQACTLCKVTSTIFVGCMCIVFFVSIFL